MDSCTPDLYVLLPLMKFHIIFEHFVKFTALLNVSLQYEMEEQRRIEDEKNVPEFVRVKENLRHIQLTQQN